MRRAISSGTCAALVAAAILAVSPAAAPAGGGLSGKYSGKLTRAGPMTGKRIKLRVSGHRARLSKLPLVINCHPQTGERVERVARGGSGKIKQGFSHRFFNIHRLVKHFAGGRLHLKIGVDFHGTTMVGMFEANLDYGNRGSCGNFGYFRAKRH